MVFCPEAFDFDRVNRAGTHWVGPCIDYERREPDFAWDSLPANRRIAYCALGTQSARQPNAVKALRTVLEVFSARDDYFLVLVCNRHQKDELPRAGSSVMLIERAPQLALLRRASVALIHGGFNSLKECAALGVPVIALPLGMDQPRNAALARHHGFAIALDVNRLTRTELDDAVSAVDSDPVRQACARMKSLFAEAAAEPLALRFVEAMLATLENGIERA
jgi:zeaxanthin glucosyltransferase